MMPTDFVWQRQWRIDALELGWLTAAIALPLAINPWGSNVFELPKAALLRALVLLMTLVALVRIGDGRANLRWSENRLLVFCALALGSTFALGTAFSINSRASLWGDYARQQGFMTLWAYLALFLLTATFLHTREQAEHLWLALVWGSVPILIYALAQAVHLDPLDWRSDAASPLVATLGRSNFVGAYLVLVFPLTIARLSLSSFKPIYILLLAAQLLCLALTQARGAWIGAGGAMLTMAILIWISGRKKRAVSALIALSACAILLIAFLVLIPKPNRLLSLARTDEGSTAARLAIWQTTLSLIASRPLLGFGPDTMGLAFPRVFPPQLVYYQGRLLTVDRAHNVWLDTAISSGALGLLCLGVLLCVLARSSLKKWRGISDVWERWLWIALAGTVIGHLMDLEFGFEVIATASVFWLTLALIAALGSGLSALTFDETEPRRWTGRLPYAPAAALIVLIIGTISARPLLADIASRESQMATQTLAERIDAGQRAVELWSLEPEYHLRLAWLYFEVGAIANAEVQIGAADQLSPGNPRIEATRGDMFARTGRFAHAEDAYRHAVEIAPNIAAYHAALGWSLMQQSRQEEAAAEFKRAVDLDATDAASYRALAEVYASLGWHSEALWAQREAQRWSSK